MLQLVVLVDPLPACTQVGVGSVETRQSNTSGPPQRKPLRQPHSKKGGANPLLTRVNPSKETPPIEPKANSFSLTSVVGREAEAGSSPKALLSSGSGSVSHSVESVTGREKKKLF